MFMYRFKVILDCEYMSGSDAFTSSDAAVDGAVTPLEYCRYAVKPKVINQLTSSDAEEPDQKGNS